MRNSIGATARQMQSNSLGRDLTLGRPRAAKIHPDLIADQTASNQEPEPFVQPVEPLLAIVDEARIRCGMSLKEMAIAADVNLGTFCDAMKGKPGKNFNVSWLDPQPIRYRITFAKLLSQKHGISREQERAIVIQRLFDSIEDLLTLTMTAVSE